MLSVIIILSVGIIAVILALVISWADKRFERELCRCRLVELTRKGDPAEINSTLLAITIRPKK